MRAAAPVGVLAIQGDYDAHAAALRELGAQVRLVRAPEDLAGLAALVCRAARARRSPWGWRGSGSTGRSRTSRGRVSRCSAPAPERSCSRARSRTSPVPALGLVDVVARRNAYGTQVDSFAAAADPGGGALAEGLRCVFIRAPRLERPGPAVEVLARVDGQPVWVQQGRIQLTTFHPELTPDRRVHARLLELAG